MYFYGYRQHQPHAFVNKLNYNIRRPVFHLPFIKHSFAEQRLDYQLIKILNVHGSMLYARKVQHLFFYAFKTFVKYEILKNYIPYIHHFYIPFFECRVDYTLINYSVCNMNVIIL